MVLVSFKPLVFSRVAQNRDGQINGSNIKPSRPRLANAAISLENPLSGRQTQTTSDDHGQFHFTNVPYAAYILHVSAKGFTPSTKAFTVRSNVPVQFSIRLSVAATGSEITVHPDLL